MKIFISWSGNQSRAIAELLSDWIKCVLQATRPWVSTRDIDRGALWFSEIGDQLKDTSVGIICLTQENKTRPWILFEAGALAKGLSTSRVCTLLIDLKSSDLQDPLAQFNHTTPDHDYMWELVRTLNGCLDSSKLDERILVQVFETYWPQFETEFKSALKANPPGEKVEPRSEESILGEILENTRSLSSRVKNLENTSGFRREGSVSSRRIALNPVAMRRLNSHLTPKAQSWLNHASLLKDVDGNIKEFQIRAQDLPDEEMQLEIQIAVWQVLGGEVKVVYRGVPSQ